MAEIKLTPNGQLCWVADDEQTAAAALGKVFERNRYEGMFVLAADKIDVAGAASLRYIQTIAGHYLTKLCHIPESADNTTVAQPGGGELTRWLLTLPPMLGAEYVCEDVLRAIWAELDNWVQEKIASGGGLKSFLQKWAPKWHQVGRVCFHLAENKADQTYPFAFMATYSTGFGAEGKLKHLPLRTAIEQYAGAENRSALINLLSPVQQASSLVEWVGELVESGRIYRPLAWTTDAAYQFLISVPKLEEAGLSVRVPNWWQKRPHPAVSVKIGDKQTAKLGAEALLDFDVGFALGDESLTEAELRELLGGNQGLVWFKGQWVEVDKQRLQEAIEHWEMLRRHSKDGEISFIAGMRLLAGASVDLKHETKSEQEQPWVHIEAGDAMRRILADLRDPARLGGVNSAVAINATLRPYQEHGVAWLNFLTQLGLGACLADDMGLGKTLQVLALLSALGGDSQTGKHRPSLLVVPASLLGNWREESRRFTPSIRLTFLHPAENGADNIERVAADPIKELAQTDLAITTYSMLTRQDWLTKVNWRLVILDEAQAIKNPSTAQSRSVKKLSCHSRIAMTGTPVENRLGDLWSLFDFLNPGLLGSESVFKSFVKGLQSRERDQFVPLRRLVTPYILRRLKTDRSIIADLPEKIETSSYCKLSKPQIKLYQAAVNALKEKIASSDGIARRGLVLQSLMRFKQICNHPAQLTGDGDYNPLNSGKFLRIREICEEIASRQEKVLVFTQFQEIIEPLVSHLASIFGRNGLSLHGGIEVRKRKHLVEQFQSDEGAPFFVLSLKAGGTGLNLTAASHIIHFDRWWNPAVENQATDRAFRIGQKRNVLVHKFVTIGTIEERIDRMIAEKQKMADEILSSGGEMNLTELSDEQLLDIVSLDVNRAQL